MSSFDKFNSLYDRIYKLDEMADSFKRTVKGAAGGEDGLNIMLKAYRNERTGKPVGAVSRVKNLIVLRALYDKDYINDEQFQALAKKATSSNYISNTLKEINPEAHTRLFGSKQESDEIINHIKLNAKDMLNFGLTNLQGKNYVEAPVEDTPDDPDAEELEDEVTGEVVALAKGLTSKDLEGTILDFDDVDVTLQGLDNQDDITRKLLSVLNGAGYTAEATPAGFNVEAPIGSFGTEEDVQDLMTGLILKYFPGVSENGIGVLLNTTVEDAESFNEKPDLEGEIDPTRDPRSAGEALHDDEDARQHEKDKAGPTIPGEYASDEEDSLEARVQAALSSGGIDKGDARDIQRNSDAAFENILSPAIETARQDPDMTYAEVKGMIEAQLDRKCTEDECKDIKHDLYDMHGEEGDQERAEGVLNAEDGEGSVKQQVLDNCKQNAVKVMGDPSGVTTNAGMALGCKEAIEEYKNSGDTEKEKIASNLFYYFDEQDKGGFQKSPYKVEGEEKDISEVEDYETVTERYQNQQHLDVSTHSTNMYLTEQTKKDSRNKKQTVNTVSFKERYKPKTSHQLDELRRYGL